MTSEGDGPRSRGRYQPRAGKPFVRRLPRAKEVLPAARAIAAALKVHGISDAVRANRLVTEWTELVGAKIAQRTRPDGVNDRVLWVEVATSAWMHELNLLRAQLLAGLTTRLGEPTLFDELRFKLAGRDRRPALTVPISRARVAIPRPMPPPATGAAREQIAREVATVDDDELRELIARVRIAHDK